MSASSNAVPLGGPFKDEKGKPVRVPAICRECNWKGDASDLLCDPDERDDEDGTLWCPQCKMATWEYL